MTADIIRPQPRGYAVAALSGALAGLLLMALVVAVFVGFAASRSAAIAQGVEVEIPTMVMFGFNGVLFVLTIGWIFALPVAFLHAGIMALGERIARPVFASLPAWLLGGAIASLPLGYLAWSFDGPARIGEARAAQLVLGCGMIAAGVAWLVRYRSFAKAPTARTAS